MNSDSEYRRIFDDFADVNVYLASLEIVKQVETLMFHRVSKGDHEGSAHAKLFRFQYATFYVAWLTQNVHCSDAEIIALANEGVDPQKLRQLHVRVGVIRKRFTAERKMRRKLHRRREFTEYVLDALLQGTT